MGQWFEWGHRCVAMWSRFETGEWVRGCVTMWSRFELSEWAPVCVTMWSRFELSEWVRVGLCGTMHGHPIGPNLIEFAW